MERWVQQRQRGILQKEWPRFRRSGQDRKREGGKEKLITRERELQRQWEETKITNAKYNRRYKDIRGEEDVKEYLKKECLDKEWKGDNVRALIKLRCGNLEEMNKYWLEAEEGKRCVFCEIEEDSMEYFVYECRITSR